MKKNLLIFGAGQYGQVAKEIAKSTKNFNRIEFLDDNNEKAIGKICEYKKFKKEFSTAFVAIGNVEIRLKLIEELDGQGFEVVKIVSPTAQVSPSAQVKSGTIVEHMAVISANSFVGEGVFVCAGAIVNHNATVGDGCQIDCGSVVGSNAVVPPKTKLAYNEVFYKQEER